VCGIYSFREDLASKKKRRRGKGRRYLTGPPGCCLRGKKKRPGVGGRRSEGGRGKRMENRQEFIALSPQHPPLLLFLTTGSDFYFLLWGAFWIILILYLVMCIY